MVKHRFNIMGINRFGKVVGCSLISDDIINAIKICRENGINPHSVSQAEQVSANAVIGLIQTYYDNIIVQKA